MGFKLEDIKEIDNFYIVQGDIAFSKSIQDDNTKNELYAKNSTPSSRMLQPAGSYAHSDELISGLNVQDITIYSEISTLTFGDPWNDAINNAIYEWNSSNSCVNFRQISSPSNADITIRNTTNSSLFGYAEFPVNGNTAPVLWINANYNNGNTSSSDKTNILMHELGHALGFIHVDQTSSVGGYNPFLPSLSTQGSVMISGVSNILNRAPVLTTNDKLAVEYLYDPNNNCERSITTNSGTINGPSSICRNSSSSTYTWSGTGTIDDWTGTNLTLTNETGSSVTVSTSSGSSSGTLQAIQNGNIVASKVIQINSGPNISGASIDGPNSMNTGPFYSELFYVSNVSSGSYTSATWTIYSFTFQNAIQYFQIDSPAGNNPLNAIVTANSATPSGTYTIACNISDNCGTSIVTKTFTVN
ncbi:M57 family metalloprotease [Kordia periserrulae]|nr:M57 family metalloprotease [Kordia periserrulae]